MAALGGEPLQLFGTDYPTQDGTAVRDYVHVADLASAHLLALRHLGAGGASFVSNVGTGRGHSVREVIETVERVSGRVVPRTEVPRRAGDSPTTSIRDEEHTFELTLEELAPASVLGTGTSQLCDRLWVSVDRSVPCYWSTGRNGLHAFLQLSRTQQFARRKQQRCGALLYNCQDLLISYQE